MAYAELTRENLFPIPIEHGKTRLFLVYAPLTGDSFFATEQLLNEAEKQLKTKGYTEQDDIRQLIREARNAMPPTLSLTPTSLTQLDIILNFKCNFACTYCFSAKGRSNAELSEQNLNAALATFFSKPFDIRTVVFTGGGEPLISKPLLKQAVTWIRQHTTDRSIDISVVTNGSLLTEDFIDFLNENKVSLVVSFEILRDLQEKQRSNYELCLRNIRMAIRKHCVPGLRVTITPESVERMNEMVLELHRILPEIEGFAFEAVVAPALFATPQDLGRFYRCFIRNFSQCRKTGRSMGVEAACTSFMALDATRRRMCPGKLCLTPQGMLTNCSRVSSPKEEGAQHYFYGSCQQGTLTIREEDFARHIKSHSLDALPQCQTCWAKWNCGGGCARIRETFPTDFMEEYCQFMKGCILQEMLDRYDVACQQQGTTLQQVLQQVAGDSHEN